MPDDVKPASETGQEIIPAHLADARTDGSAKPPLIARDTLNAILPTTLEEAYRYAVMVVGAGLAPDSYSYGSGPKKDEADPQKVLIGILKSLEVGLPPLTGLANIAIINKRPCIWGDGAVALVQSCGIVEKIEFFFEGEKEQAKGPVDTGTGELDHSPTIADFPETMTAVYRIWRKGQENAYEGRFSVRDAKRAHLWGNAKRVPWLLYPKRMLLNRARAFALRDGFADALAGLSIREEVEDLPTAPPARTDTSFLDDAPQQIEHKPSVPFAAPLETRDGVSVQEKGSPLQPPEAPHPAAVAPQTAGDRGGTPEHLGAPPAAQLSPAATDYTPAPAEPPIPKAHADLGVYARQLAAWIPAAPEGAYRAHMEKTRRWLDVMRAHREKDWQIIAEAMDARRA